MGIGKPKPHLDVDNRPYFEAAASRRFVIQRCQSCGRWAFFPRNSCPVCLSEDLEWAEPSGTGKLLSFCVVQRPHHPAFDDEVPIVFAAIRLAEGPTMLAELRRAESETIEIGMPLRIDFAEIDEDLVLPVWSTPGFSLE